MTIKDVAKKAGVAVSTASYALNNSPKVSEKTKKRILRIAKDLGYEPNAFARDLKKQSTDTIGLFLSDLAGPFFSEFIRGIQDTIQDTKYNLILCSSFGGKKSTAVKYLKEKRVDAAIIFAPSIKNDLIEKVAGKGIPVVVLDRELNSENIYSLLIDNKQGAIKAVDYLVKLGHKKLTFLSGKENAYDNRERLVGFEEAVKKNKVDGKTVNGDFTEKSGYAAALYFVQTESIPEAVFSANDEMAIGMIKCFAEYGIKVPGDVSIIGFDNIEISNYIVPKLTTVSHPKYELGCKAVEAVLAGLRGEKNKKTEVLPVELLIRESCK